MNFIDTHIHLQDYKSKSTPQIVAEAKASGVKKMICVTESETDWANAVRLYEEYPDFIIPAFGIHPWYVQKAEKRWEKRLAAMLERYPAAWVGEAGLDRLKNEDFEPQNKIFLEHIRLAKEYNRPISVHAVKAQEWLQNYWKLLPPRTIIHSFASSAELMQQALKAGAYISFSNSILKSQHFTEVAKAVPAERILLETDGPFQGPVKGEETPVGSLQDIAAALAEARGVAVEELAAQTYKNSLELINGK